MSNLKSFISWFKKDPFIHSVFLLFGVIFILILCIAGYFYLRFFVLDKYYESIIDKKFHQEVSTISQIKVKRFMLWEGDSMVDLDIQDRGVVSFWYGIGGVPIIQAIGLYYIPFVCFYVDNQGNKTGYAYDTLLGLDKNNKYQKWFPFQVNNLQDLVDKYDEIIRVLETFPKNPEMVEFEDKTWGTQRVLKNPNPNFTLIDRYKGKDIACDLYVTTR